MWRVVIVQAATQARCNRDLVQSIALQDVDCTIERTEFDFGMACVESAEDGVAKSRVHTLRMNRRRETGLVIDFAFERGGAEIEGVSG